MSTPTKGESALTPNAKSKEYKSKEPEWTKIEAVMGGESAMKYAGTMYLPKLSGQTDDEYNAYISRGSFFNAFKRTVIGLTGAVVRKEPQIKCPPTVDNLLPFITLNGESIQEVIRVVIENQIEYGYFGILVDAPVVDENQAKIGSAANPYFALYPAATILNLQTKQIGDESKLVMLCLSEKVDLPSTDNPFVMVSEDRVRVLTIEGGILVVKVYRKVLQENNKKEIWEQVGGDMYPKIRGKNWTEIPFVFFGCISNSPIPEDPPLIDLANLNIKHWQVNVDYYHGLHYCALPTPYACGFGKDTTLYLGALKAWISEDPTAKCGFLEFTGQGLEAVVKALERIEAQMAVMGARLLEDQKKAAEAADTVRMHFSGDSATLSSIVNSSEQGFIKALNYLAQWIGAKESSEVKLNREFVSEKLSAQDITALLQARQAGEISQDTFLYKLQLGEILPADRTIEQEKALAKEQKPFQKENGAIDENNMGS